PGACTSQKQIATLSRCLGDVTTSRYSNCPRPEKGRDVMNTQELAKTFTDMCAKGEFDAAGKKFWSDGIESREPMTGEMAVLKGRKAVEGKGEWWYANHEVHNVKVEVPMCTAISSSCASRWTSRPRVRLEPR